MAEHVEYNMERGMKDLENLISNNVFNAQQITEVIQRREQLEYAITRQARSLADVMSYIRFEIQLANLIRERSDSKIAQRVIDSICAKIVRLFVNVVERYPDDWALWQEYLAFLLHVDSVDGSDVRRAFDGMRNFHADKALCWLQNIAWERQHSKLRTRNRDIRTLALQALKRIPDSVALAVELLDIVLSSDEPESTRLQQAIIAFRSCAQQNNCLDLFVALLNEADRHAFAGPLRSAILDAMLAEHHGQERFWHELAQRELRGLSTAMTADAPDDDAEAALRRRILASIGAPGSSSARHRIERCASVYEAAVRQLNTSAMWSHYVDAMLSLNEQRGLLALRRRLLGRALKRADEANRLTDKLYAVYVTLLGEFKADDGVIEPILSRACQQWPRSCELWTLQIRFCLERRQTAQAKRLLLKADRLLAEADSVTLWQAYVVALRAEPKANAADISSAYEKLMVGKRDPAFDELKVDFLEWTYAQSKAKAGAIERLWSAYNGVQMLGSPCMALFRKFLALADGCEKTATWPIVTRKAFDMAMALLDRTSADIWLLYMDFERGQGRPSVAYDLHLRALKRLPEPMLTEFKQKYSVQNSHK